jgi:hypothetical protein
VRASPPHCSVLPADPEVMILSSSDTEEALELLFLSPPRNLISRVSEPSTSFSSNQFEDWPEANDIVASTYIALTADALSSRILMVNAPRGGPKSYAGSSCTRHSHSQAYSS